MTFKRPTKGRSIRAGYGIVGWVGANGGGKTAGMVWDTMPFLEAGRPALSTVRLQDYLNPRLCTDEECHIIDTRLFGRVQWWSEPCDKTDPLRHAAAHPLWVPFMEWSQLLEWSFGNVLMDEVSGVASSRNFHSMPGEVEAHLQQLRKGDAVVHWSAPSFKRADTVIRECSQIIVNCRGKVKKSHQAREGEVQRRWKQRRLFLWTSYDAYQFEDFTVGARERLKPIGFDYHWGPGSSTFAGYDTYQKALALGGSNAHTGRCMACGGRRSAPACKCPTIHPVRLGGDAGPGGPRRGSGPAPDEAAA